MYMLLTNLDCPIRFDSFDPDNLLSDSKSTAKHPFDGFAVAFMFGYSNIPNNAVTGDYR